MKIPMNVTSKEWEDKDLFIVGRPLKGDQIPMNVTRKQWEEIKKSREKRDSKTSED